MAPCHSLAIRITQCLRLEGDKRCIPLFNRHFNPFFPWGFRVPQKKVHGRIRWEPVEIQKTSVKIPLQNARGFVLNLFGHLPGNDDPEPASIGNVLVTAGR